MSDPARFGDGGGGELEKLVVESVRDEAPSPRVRRRVEAALGLGAATAISTTTATSALGASVKTGVTFAVTKWITVAAITVVAGAGAATYVAHQTRAGRATPPAPSAVQSPPIVRGAPSSAMLARPAPPVAAAPSAEVVAMVDPSATASVAAPAPSAHPALTLGDELRLLDEAHAALTAGDTGRALALLDRHDREARKPGLAPEALALRAEVYAHRGDRASAARIATQFLALYGDRPEAQRMRTILEATSDSTNP
jgi:hypothetical protein